MNFSLFIPYLKPRLYYQNTDAISEIVLNIKLPPLPDNLVWKDNLISLIVNEIKLIHLTDYGDVTLSKNYIDFLINEQSNIRPAKSMFYNLSYNQREKLSRKEINLILPLQIKNFIKNPSIIYTVLYLLQPSPSMEISFNYHHLVENNTSFTLDSIEWTVDIIGSYYEHDFRTKLCTNRENILISQIIEKYI